MFGLNLSKFHNCQLIESLMSNRDAPERGDHGGGPRFVGGVPGLYRRQYK